MPTIYKDQFFQIDPYAPPAVGTPLSVVRLEMLDQNDDGLIGAANNDMIDGVDITSAWKGDQVTINVPGVGNITYTGTTFYLADGRRFFTPTDGKVLQDGTFVSSSWVTTNVPLAVATDLGPTCFGAGTRIAVPGGWRRVEELVPGDLVETRDHGPQRLIFVARRSHQARGKAAPVRIAAGALGNEADLVVSQPHRMLVTGWRAELYLGVPEALVAARHLVNGRDITLEPGGEVQYHHLLLPRHEIICAEGAWTESFHPAHALGLGDRALWAEVSRRFPALMAQEGACWQAARQVARGHEGVLLAA